MWKKLCFMFSSNISGFRFFPDSVHNLRNSRGRNYKCEKFYSKLLSVVLADHREFTVDFSSHIICIISYYTAAIVVLQLLARTHNFCLYLRSYTEKKISFLNIVRVQLETIVVHSAHWHCSFIFICFLVFRPLIQLEIGAASV